MKAIETRYKGYRFRSRLEARWAVFFDALNLEWEYEPEGFDLGEAGWYLPDFRIYGKDTNGDDMNYWFDVKPMGVPISTKTMNKMEAFADSAVCSGYTSEFIILEGSPGDKMIYEGLHSGFGYMLWSRRKRPWWMEPGCEEELVKWHIENSEYHRRDGDWHEDYNAACEKARSARFEHGETP